MNIRKIIASAVTAGALLLCGCGKTDTESSAADSYNVPAYTLAGEYREGRPNVYLIVKSITNSYFRVMFDAAEDAARELDCNVYYSGSELSSEWKAQADLMDMAAENGADAIILAPNDSVSLVSKVKEIYGKGISVICVDAVINCDSYDACFMTDNLSAGEQAAAELLTHLKNSGLSPSEGCSIAIQTGRSASQTISERVAGFCQYWTENAPAEWKIITDIKSNDGDDSKAYSLAEEYFKEYSDIRGVFGTNNGTTRGFAEYISKSGRKDVAVVGFDYSDAIASLVNDSSYMASAILQRQYDMAYNGIKTAVEIKNGTYAPESKLTDTGVLAVNNTNINDPEVRATVERN